MKKILNRFFNKFRKVKQEVELKVLQANVPPNKNGCVGQSGYSGINGATGTSGYSGLSGYSGYLAPDIIEAFDDIAQNGKKQLIFLLNDPDIWKREIAKQILKILPILESKD